MKDVTFPSLKEIPIANQKGGFAAAEAYAWHRSLLEKDASRYDPRVASRILRGKEMSAADYIDLLQARRQIIAEAGRAFAGYDAILMPTVPRIAPRIADLQATMPPTSRRTQLCCAIPASSTSWMAALFPSHAIGPARLQWD